MPVKIAKVGCVWLQRHRDIGTNSDQPLAQKGLVPPLFQGVPAALGGDLVQVLVDTFDSAVLLEEWRSGLFPHSPHARDVVRGIPCQRFKINELLWLQSVSLTDAVFVVDPDVGRTAASQQHTHVRVDELKDVRVAGDDECGETLTRCLVGECPQHVVGLKTFGLDDGDVHRFDDLPDAIHLVGQLLGHPGTMGFVFGIFVVAKSATGIESDDGVIRILVSDDIEQHGGKTEHSIGQFAPRRGHVGWKGVKRLKGQGVAVYQHQFPFRHVFSFQGA